PAQMPAPGRNGSASPGRHGGLQPSWKPAPAGSREARSGKPIINPAAPLPLGLPRAFCHTGPRTLLVLSIPCTLGPRGGADAVRPDRDRAVGDADHRAARGHGLGVADAVAVDDADVGERATVVDVDQPGHGAPSKLGVIDGTDGRTARHGAQRTRYPPVLGRRAPLPGAAR